MGKVFAKTTKWATLISLCCPSFVSAEGVSPVVVESTAPSHIVEALPAEVQPAAEKNPLFRHHSYPDAWKAAQKTNRPILVYVCMPNCPHCVKMMEQTYEVPRVEQMVTGSFETIHVSRYTHAKLVEKLKVKWYPTTVLVAPNNKVLDVIEGYVDAKKFHIRLQTGLASVAGATQTR